MANNDIKDFTVEWVLMGFLFLSLITFALNFSYNNNPLALGDSENTFSQYGDTMSSSLTELDTNINSDLNSSASLTSTNEEAGAGAASSTSYSLFSTAKDKWEDMKGFISWTLSGTAGKMIIAILGGILGIVGLFYVIKLIRSLK